MIVDLEQEPSPDGGRFDVCIVGAGAAGLVLAAELRRRGRRVVIAESGGLKKEARIQALYEGASTGLAYRGLSDGRVRALGGSTTEWSGQILELDESDFAPRSWVPGSGWPINKLDLVDHYARALELEGLAQAERDDEAVMTQRGLDPAALGSELQCVFTRWCPEPNFAKLFVAPLKNDRDLVLYLHANACELILDTDGETARGIRCRSLAGRAIEVVAERFILCMGGIENARFLLQPMANGAAPWNRSQLVGRHFQDHITCVIGDIKDADSAAFHRYFAALHTGSIKFHAKLKASPALQARYGILNICGVVDFAGDESEQILRARRAAQIIRRGGVRNLGWREIAALLTATPVVAARKARRLIDPAADYRGKTLGMKLAVICEQSPHSDSRITLTQERDALGLYRVSVDWRISAQELATIRRYAELARRAFAHRKLARIEPDARILADDGTLTQNCLDYYHHMGGTRMAATAGEGVVDTDLRLFGTRNVYVCSTSVFPASGFANPTHTLLALAVRLAAHLDRLPGARTAQLEMTPVLAR